MEKGHLRDWKRKGEKTRVQTEKAASRFLPEHHDIFIRRCFNALIHLAVQDGKRFEIRRTVSHGSSCWKPNPDLSESDPDNRTTRVNILPTLETHPEMFVFSCSRCARRAE